MQITDKSPEYKRYSVSFSPSDALKLEEEAERLGISPSLLLRIKMRETWEKKDLRK